MAPNFDAPLDDFNPSTESSGESMTTVSIEEAQSKLTELIDSLHVGDEIIIKRNDQQVAKIVRGAGRGPRVPDSAKGILVIHSEDNEHLNDFDK